MDKKQKRKQGTEFELVLLELTHIAHCASFGVMSALDGINGNFLTENAQEIEHVVGVIESRLADIKAELKKK